MTVLAAVGVPIIVAVLVGIVGPSITKRQTARQIKEGEEKQERKEKEAAERRTIKEKAEQDAALAAGDVVSWEKINRALAVTAQEERAAHRERIAELREDFAEEALRLKRQTDHELDRAKQEINRLSDRVEELTRQIALLAPKQ